MKEAQVRTYRPRSKNEQLILCVPATCFDHISGYQLVTKEDAQEALQAIQDFRMFTYRGPAETNPALLQAIPYVVVRDRSGQVLFYRRPPSGSGGEDRLHGRGSIGFGGHVEISDAIQAALEHSGWSENCRPESIGTAPRGMNQQEHTNAVYQMALAFGSLEILGMSVIDILRVSMRRELHEELNLAPHVTEEARLVGLLVDRSEDVGRVHLGLIYNLVLPSLSTGIVPGGEIHSMIPLPPDDLFALAGDPKSNIEGWSRLIIPSL